MARTIDMRWPDRRQRPAPVPLPDGYRLRSWVDRDAFAAVQASFGFKVQPKEWRRLLSDLVPDTMVFALAPDAQPVAVAVVRDNDGGAYSELAWVATVPAFRGLGLAQAVCAEATSLALDAGCLDLQLSTRADLKAAQHIYLKQGWVLDGRYR